jgi:hypothetical protein
VFRRILRRVIHPATYELNTTFATRYESAHMVNLAMAYLMNEKIGGDYAEFGVLRGATFVEAVRAAQLHKLDSMRFWACDSFQGLPHGGGPFEAGEFAATRKEFEGNLKAHRVPVDRVSVIEGFFDESLPGPISDEIALAWIDCDLYESTVPVLEALTDRLVQGAALCFDDWFTHRGDPDQGEQRAVREWLNSHTSLQLVPWRPFSWGGQSFLFKRRTSSP